MLSQTVTCIQALTVLQGAICTGLTRITVHNYPAKNRPEHIVIHSTFPWASCSVQILCGNFNMRASMEFPNVLGTVTQVMKHMVGLVKFLI